jgi:hypothetical protein
VRAIGASLPAGTEISFTMGMRDLIQGANTLAVVVLDRGGRRYEQVASFGVTAPPPPPRPGSLVVHLPVRGTGSAGSTPPRGAPVKPPVGVGAAPAAMKSSLARASSYVKSQAGLNLTAFRGRRR